MKLRDFCFALDSDSEGRVIGKGLAIGALACVVAAVLLPPLLWLLDKWIRYWLA